MGAGLVVVADVVGQDQLKLTTGDGEEMVRALSAHGPHPAFGERVGVRRQLHPVVTFRVFS